MDSRLKTRCTTLLFLIFGVISYGQDSKFSLVVNYSPNYSGITDEIVSAEMKLSHDIGLVLDYKLSNLISPTLSFRYFNTGEAYKTISNGSNFLIVSFSYSYDYIHIPFGIKFKVGRMDILPEIGYAIPLSQTVTQKVETDAGVEKTKRDEVLMNGEFNNLSIPISLSITTDLELKALTMQLGIKGYYSTTSIIENLPRDAHYYGVGLLLGVKF